MASGAERTPEPPSRERLAVRDPVDLESDPITRPEYISAIVHLYRGELHRATSWRIRLDATTNWAVFTTAGLLTFSFGEGKHSHWVILIGTALVSVFLAFEARRYRLADVWRSRVRKIEENFYGPILRRELVSPEVEWGKLVAEDLFHPTFKLTRLMALRVRLTRNYWPMYVVLLASWVVHVLAIPEAAESWPDVQDHLAAGLLPWWMPLAYVVLLLGAMTWLFMVTPRSPRSEEDYWSLTPHDKDSDDPVLDV